MHSLQKQFHDFIHSKQLVKGDEKILVAVSGGVDSMALANLFLIEGFDIGIAHCNFGLRGEESDEDEVFVLDWADKNGINCYVKSFDLEGSIQLEARNARYQWFNELLIELDFDKMATAHHLNDSLETVIGNLVRGTGVRGMVGIPIKNDKIIRPLLFATKKEILNYAMDQGLTWREDSSNETNNYDRNRLRHQVIPEFEKLNPSLLKTFSSTVERMSHANSIILERVADIKSRFLTADNHGFRLELEWISSSSDELILADILAEFGVNYVTSKEIFEARGKSGKSFLGKGWFLTMDRSELFIDRGESNEMNIQINELGRYQIANQTLVTEKVTRDEVSFESDHEVYLDLSKLEFPLTVRNWQEGDKFQPLGMKGNKKVSDFFIDLKVPQSHKRNVLILESNNRICWVIGYRISEQFKLSENSTDILRIALVSPS